MRKRHPNYRLAKSHRSYAVEEIARLFDVHRNTVREWIKAGLQTIDDKRPVLILGHELIAFLQARRVSKKKPCGPGQMYCVRCPPPTIPCRCNGGLFTCYGEDRKPDCYLPGLRLHHASPCEHGQARGGSRKNGHHVSASTATHKGDRSTHRQQ